MFYQSESGFSSGRGGFILLNLVIEILTGIGVGGIQTTRISLLWYHGLCNCFEDRQPTVSANYGQHRQQDIPPYLRVEQA